MKTTITKTEFAKTVKIYKSHRLKNGFISITYAYVIGDNTVSEQHTEEIEDKGGALTSLWIEKTGT